MNEKFEEKMGITQNCEISHIDRLTLEPRKYKENQNIFILSMCGAQSVEGDLSKLVWHYCFGRTCVCTSAWTFRADACVHGHVDVTSGCVCTRSKGRFRVVACMRVCTFRSYVRVYTSGVRACAWLRGRLDGRSCILNFMDDWVIFTKLYDRMQLKARHATKSKRHATKSRSTQLKVDMQCNIGGGESTKS